MCVPSTRCGCASSNRTVWRFDTPTCNIWAEGASRQECAGDSYTTLLMLVVLQRLVPVLLLC